ncbi:GNAT family N-acetyltransferase [Brevibacillus fluminis]|uniref:GNAT family N-acetyltransferase n=1 Tax=Brevibacillus fluminis TaxID=511487 RepID=UPI003F892BF7
MQSELEYRVITDAVQMEEVEMLQLAVWGEKNITPVPQLMAAIHNGGVVIAAYHEGKPVGFCYGFAGFKAGKSHLCSHMLGILPAYRDWGIGKQLKLRQREWAIAYGYEKMTWTYDPLEARNAYLNLCKLGGIVRTYMESYYGEMKDGINKGLPTDRFLLEWHLLGERATRGVEGVPLVESKWKDNPWVLDWQEANGYPHPLARGRVGEHDGMLLAVPAAIHSLKKEQLEIAAEWRMALRRMCQDAFAQGYIAVGLLKTEGPVHAYVLERIQEEGDV